jgi:hypothetical protein
MGLDEVPHIEIRNSLGQHVLITNSAEINLSAQPKGVYFLHLKTERGAEAMRKIILQ